MSDSTWLPQLNLDADLKHSEASSLHYSGFKPKMCYHWDGNDLQSEFILDEQYQGWPGVVHGGTLMAMLDEGMGYETYIQGLKCVTAEMHVKFKKPTPLGKALKLRASTSQKNRRLVEVVANISTEDNTVTIESTASFFVFNSENIVGKRLTKAVIWALEGVIIDSSENLKPQPGAIDLVKQAAESGIKNIILPTLPLKNLEDILSSLGIKEYVQTVDHQHFIPDKITPENLSSVMEANKLSWDECVTIQSAPAGIAAANRIPLRCIAVSGTYSKQGLGDSDLLVDSLVNLTPLNLEHLSIVYIPQPPSSVRKWVGD